MPQQEQIQSRNMNLLSSQGPSPLGQTRLSDDETTNHEEHESGPPCLDDEPEITDSTAPGLHQQEPIKSGHEVPLWDLLTMGAALYAAWFIYNKLCGAARYVQSSLTFFVVGFHPEVHNDIENPEVLTTPPRKKIQQSSKS